LEPITNPLLERYVPDERVPMALRSIVEVTHDRHVDMVNLVRDLPDEALSWRPGPRMNALAGLVWHIMDIEERVLGAVAGDPAAVPGENGALLDRTGTAASVVERIAHGDAALIQAFEALTDADLVRELPAWEATVLAVIVSESDHCAMHYGQMQLTRHLYEHLHPGFHSAYQHWW
jgi:hypothetical protein